MKKFRSKLVVVLALWPGLAFSKVSRTIVCDETNPQEVVVPIGRVTALSFPTTPKDVVPGEAGFDFKTIRHDLVIKVMRLGAKTNLFVYLDGRRCSFHLVSRLSGDEILTVKDPKDKTVEVKFVN